MCDEDIFSFEANSGNLQDGLLAVNKENNPCFLQIKDNSNTNDTGSTVDSPSQSIEMTDSISSVSHSSNQLENMWVFINYETRSDHFDKFVIWN